MKLPEKEFLDFADLKEKWQCSSRDLFHLIATEKLTPSVLICGRYDPFQLIQNHEDDLVAYELHIVDPSAVAEPLKGIFYLCSMAVTSPRKCQFNFFSEKRSPVENDVLYKCDHLIEIELDYVSKSVKFQGGVVFVPAEIERFETEHACLDLSLLGHETNDVYPWGKHDTKWLRHLSEAAVKFWSLYDPSDPSTAPTNEQVEKWLVARAVPKRTAEVMATILRADSLPTGRRKFE